MSVHLDKATRTYFYFFYFGVRAKDNKPHQRKRALGIKEGSTPKEMKANAVEARNLGETYDKLLKRLLEPGNATNREIIGADVDKLFDWLKGGGYFLTQPVTNTLTVSQLYERFHTLIGAKRGDRTKQVDLIYKRHFEKAWGNRKLSSLKPTDLVEYVNKRVQQGKDRVTVKKEVENLKAVWGHMVKLGEAPPIISFSNLPYPPPKPVQRWETWDIIEERFKSTGNPDEWELLVLTESSIDELLDAAEANPSEREWFNPWLVLVAKTGIRRGESTAIKMRDVNWEKNYVTVYNPKNKNKARMVPISPRLRKALDKWLVIRPQSDYLFCNPDGEQLRVRQVEGHFIHYFRNSEHGKLWKYKHLGGTHIFRHSLISNLAHAGKADALIMQMAGHVTKDMLERYRHFRESAVLEVIQGVYT